MNFNLSSNDRKASLAKPGTKRVSTAIALGALLLAQLSTHAQASPSTPVFSDPIVGAWNVVVDIYNCNTGDLIVSGSQSMALFNADGTRHETAASNPALRTPGFGNWHQVAKNEYEFAFKFYRFSATGTFIGSTTIRHDLLLSDDGQGYSSEGITEIRDTADNLLATGCGSGTATRFE